MRNAWKVRIGALVASLGIGQIAHSAPTDAQPLVKDHVAPAGEALARRTRSNAVMVREHVPVNTGLPAIESQADVRPPSTEEIAMRAAATLIVALKAEGVEQRRLDAVIDDYALAQWLSPEEKTFLTDPAPTQRERDIHLWRYEAANVLLWSLGYVDTLSPPRAQCDPAPLAALLKDNSRAQFLAKARRRPFAEILDQADLIYRYRWALVDAEINHRPAPAGLSNDVAMERHHALNWILYHAETAWDDITLDT